jgi:hypothetical protein
MNPNNDGTTSFELLRPFEDSSYGAVKRLSARIVIPLGRDEDAVRATFRRAAKEIIEQERPDALFVFGFRPGDPTGGHYSVGRLTYAANGKWEDARLKGPVQVTIELGSLYFAPPLPSEESIQGQVWRVTPNGRPAIISDAYGAWGDEQVVARLAAGTSVTIMQRKSQPFTADHEFIRYRVRADVEGATVEGWMHASDLEREGAHTEDLSNNGNEKDRADGGGG